MVRFLPSLSDVIGCVIASLPPQFAFLHFSLIHSSTHPVRFNSNSLVIFFILHHFLRLFIIDSTNICFFASLCLLQYTTFSASVIFAILLFYKPSSICDNFNSLPLFIRLCLCLCSFQLSK